MSDLLNKMSDSLIRSFLVSNLSNSLISSEQPERIAHGCSFLVSELSSFDLSKMSNSLTSLTKKREMSKNERFANFYFIFYFFVYKTF